MGSRRNVHITQPVRGASQWKQETARARIFISQQCQLESCNGIILVVISALCSQESLPKIFTWFTTECSHVFYNWHLQINSGVVWCIRTCITTHISFLGDFSSLFLEMQVFKQFAGKRLVLHVHVLCSPHPQSLVQNASTVSYKIKSISDRQTLQTK